MSEIDTGFEADCEVIVTDHCLVPFQSDTEWKLRGSYYFFLDGCDSCTKRTRHIILHGAAAQCHS